MTGKFLRRTFGHLVSPRSPYFVHLALTHRCNLRCRFCQIPATPVPELDFGALKRVVDRLDRLGVAVVAITGGEPLLHPDVGRVIDYGAAKGLYIKVSSNGTMPLAKYRDLAASNVAEVGISLDGVRGNDLPYGHVGPRILETIRFLSEQLPHDRRLTLNITVSQANYGKVDEIVDYCTREFPRARLWLNPVVVGVGMLRTNAGPRVDPQFLARLKSPNLEVPRFYQRACQECYQTERYVWHCRAGQAFFDVKPNGDLWLCQDVPAAPLNLLDPEFERKYRELDVSPRGRCSGCTYSCYLVIQRGFEPRHWRDMALQWWFTTTQPGEPCRDTAHRYGAAAGLAHFVASRLSASLAKGTWSRVSANAAGRFDKLERTPPSTAVR